MEKFRLSTTAARRLKKQLGVLPIQVDRAATPQVASGGGPNALHYAALRALPPEVFIREILSKVGEQPQLDELLDGRLEKFPDPIFHSYILAGFPQISSIAEISALCHGRTPLEILESLSNHAGTPYFFQSAYFASLDLAASPRLRALVDREGANNIK